jgi:hypothetical protein
MPPLLAIAAGTAVAIAIAAIAAVAAVFIAGIGRVAWLAIRYIWSD